MHPFGPRGWGPHDGEVRTRAAQSGRAAVLQAHAETRARPVPAFSGGSAFSSDRMWKERASSRRAIAVVAMLLPRRWASWA